MLLMLLWAIVAAREREDQRIVALKRSESAQNTRKIRQLIVGKNTSSYDVRTHRWTPLIKDLRSVAQHFAVVGPGVSGSRPQRQIDWTKVSATLMRSAGDNCRLAVAIPELIR